MEHPLIEQIITRYAANLTVVIAETKPSPDELRQLLRTELHKLASELIENINGAAPNAKPRDLEVKQ